MQKNLPIYGTENCTIHRQARESIGSQVFTFRNFTLYISIYIPISEHNTIPILNLIALNIQAVFVQQEVIDAHNQNPILIVMRCRSILSDDHPLEEISGHHQRTLFLLHLCLIRNRVCGLDADTYNSNSLNNLSRYSVSSTAFARSSNRPAFSRYFVSWFIRSMPSSRPSSRPSYFIVFIIRTYS